MVTVQPYQEYIQTNIFQPLNMTRSYFSLAEARQNCLSTGYHIWYSFPVPMQKDMPENAASYGFMISSVEDLSHYLVAYLDQE